MDWTHRPKANDLYNTSSPELEPTEKEKARPPKKSTWRRNLDAEKKKKRKCVAPADSLRGCRGSDVWRVLVGGLCPSRDKRQL